MILAIKPGMVEEVKTPEPSGPILPQQSRVNAELKADNNEATMLQGPSSTQQQHNMGQSIEHKNGPYYLVITDSSPLGAYTVLHSIVPSGFVTLMDHKRRSPPYSPKT